MLHLRYETPLAWTESALADPNALLVDHKLCEGKAAAMARAFVKRYGDLYPKLVPFMEELAKEEDEHEALCERILKERGAPTLIHHGNPYVSALRSGVHREPGGGGVLDQLLVASMIEARSCERFKLLATALRGETMGRFYADLFASEARHHATFVKLAVDFFGEERALARLDQVSKVEERAIATRPWGAYIH